MKEAQPSGHFPFQPELNIHKSKRVCQIALKVKEKPKQTREYGARILQWGFNSKVQLWKYIHPTDCIE